MSSRSARLSLGFSCLGHAYMHMFTSFYAVIVLSLESAWSLPYHELIELWTLGALLVGLGALPSGWLADRWSATGMMVIYFLGMGLAGIVCGLVDGKLAMLLGLAAIGLFSSIYHPVGIAWLVRNAKERGRALGINGVFGSLGIASAAVVAGTLIHHFGWRAAFIVPGAVCLVTGLALLFCARRGWVREGEGDPHRDPPRSRGDMLRVFAILIFTMLCIGVIFQSTQIAMPKLFDLRLDGLAGAGVLGIGLLVGAVYVVGGAMQIVGGLMADRFPLKPIYLGAFVLQVPVLVGVALLSDLPLIFFAIMTVVLSNGPIPAENMLLACYTPRRHRGLAFGVKFVLSFGTGPLALLLVAGIQETTGEFTWLFGMLGGLAAACVAVALFLPGESRRVPVPAAQPRERGAVPAE